MKKIFLEGAKIKTDLESNSFVLFESIVRNVYNNTRNIKGKIYLSETMLEKFNKLNLKKDSLCSIEGSYFLTIEKNEIFLNIYATNLGYSNTCKTELMVYISNCLLAKNISFSKKTKRYTTYGYVKGVKNNKKKDVSVILDFAPHTNANGRYIGLSSKITLFGSLGYNLIKSNNYTYFNEVINVEWFCKNLVDDKELLEKRMLNKK